MPRKLLCLLGVLMLLSALAPVSSADSSGGSALIAVFPLSSTRGSAKTRWVGHAAAQTVTARLNTVPGVTAFEPAELRKLIREARSGDGPTDAAAVAIAVGRKLGATRIVIGSYSKPSSVTGVTFVRSTRVVPEKPFTFSIRIIDVKTEEDVGHGGAQGLTDELFDVFQQLALDVVKSLEGRPLSERQIETMAQTGVTNIHTLTALGLGLAQTRTDSQLESYEQALGFDPRYPWVYYNRAFAHLDKRDEDKAVRDLTTAVFLKPDYAAAYYIRGRIHARTGRYDRAAADYAAAIKLKPNLAEAYFLLGQVNVRTNQYVQAILNFTRAIELRPDYAPPYYHRGHMHDLRGEYDRAISDYTKNIELDSENALAYLNRGVNYFMKAQYGPAITDLDKAIELAPELAAAYRNRGATHYVMGNHADALRDYDKAIELNKDDDPGPYYERGQVHDDKDDKAGRRKAIQDYTKAIELRPEFAESYFARAVAHYRDQAYTRAWTDIAKCRELGSEIDSEFLERLEKASGRKE